MTTGYREPLALVDIEWQIVDISDELAAETNRYEELEVAAATYEADYKGAFARAILAVPSHDSAGEKITVGKQEAIAEDATANELRLWKIADARRRSSKEALLSLRARIDALRTLAANVRVQT